MTGTKVRVERPAVVLHTRPVLEMDEEQFFEFCQLNKDWRFERKVHVYRPKDQVETATRQDKVSGEPMLPGCVLDLKPIWEVGL